MSVIQVNNSDQLIIDYLAVYKADLNLTEIALNFVSDISLNLKLNLHSYEKKKLPAHLTYTFTQEFVYHYTIS